jgi:hypothetical protein
MTITKEQAADRLQKAIARKELAEQNMKNARAEADSAWFEFNQALALNSQLSK